MTWKVTCVMEERFRLIEACEREEGSLTELCRRFGVSRKTGYKWLARYEEAGMEGLQDLSRAPHQHPNQVASEVEERVLELRREHPSWGPKKLYTWLARREPEIHWPARSTMGEIVQRHGLSWARRPRRRATPSQQPLAHAGGPNQVWCADYKGWFVYGNGQRCYPLTITDAYSRFLLRCQAMQQSETVSAQRVFEAAFREYGMPEAIRTDNGSPFATVGVEGLSRLSVWWIKLGIRPERIEPGEPQQNGRHERMHRTLKAETTQPAARNRRAQQERFDRFQAEYNHERPHEALDFAVPSTYYAPSSRPFPDRLTEADYPSHFEVRRVSHNGDIRWDYARMSLGRALSGERVGLEPARENWWRVWFHGVCLGVFDERMGGIRGSQRRVGWLKLQSPSGLLPLEPPEAEPPEEC